MLQIKHSFVCSMPQLDLLCHPKASIEITSIICCEYPQSETLGDTKFSNF